MKMPRLLIVLPFLLLATACVSTETKGPAKVVLVESQEELDLSDANGRVSVRVNDGDTLFVLDDRRFICRGVAGYIGRFDTHAGWLKAGKLEFGYDRDKVWVRGPKSWSTFPREGEQNYVVDQTGALGRSVFRE